MLRVKIYTETYNYYIDDVNSYDNAINVLSKRLGYNPHIYKICHVDEYEEELETITGDELDNTGEFLQCSRLPNESDENYKYRLMR